MIWNTGLTGAALEIAASPRSPLRVVAGPGTGKTFALMRRVARLLEEGTKPRRVLMITYTRAAAADLQAELTKLEVDGAESIWCGTLHSFCFSLLNRASVLGMIGRAPRPLLAFETRVMQEDLALQVHEDYHARCRRLRAFEAAWAREQHQEPGWPFDEMDKQFQRALLDWLKYHEAMLLGELVPLTLQYLTDNPDCPERRRFGHALVDEYQDLNKAEQSLLDILSDRGSITVVGDEDQSIYESLRYAHPEGIARFSEHHDDTHSVSLDACRRCPETMVRMANDLISHNTLRSQRLLSPFPGNPDGEVYAVQWPDMSSEASGIADFICDRIAQGRFAPGQVLVLCPRRQFGYEIRDALLSKGCPAISFFNEEMLEGNPKKFDTCLSQQAYTLLLLAVNPSDRTALRCWLAFGSRTLANKEYERVLKQCAKHGESPWDVLDAAVEGAINLPYTRHSQRRFGDLKTRLAQLRELNDSDTFDSIFPAGEDWAIPFREIREQMVEGWTLSDLHSEIRRRVTQPEMPRSVDYVRVMSLHKSKGLTADHVILTGFVEGLIPSPPKSDNPTAMRREKEEQRRLAYVAVTRARQTLVLSSVRSLPRDVAHQMQAKVYGGDMDTARTITSTFLHELGPSCPKPVSGSEWSY